MKSLKQIIGLPVTKKLTGIVSTLILETVSKTNIVKTNYETKVTIKGEQLSGI